MVSSRVPPQEWQRTAPHISLGLWEGQARYRRLIRVACVCLNVCVFILLKPLMGLGGSFREHQAQVEQSATPVHPACSRYTSQQWVQLQQILSRSCHAAVALPEVDRLCMFVIPGASKSSCLSEPKNRLPVSCRASQHFLCFFFAFFSTLTLTTDTLPKNTYSLNCPSMYYGFMQV